MRVQIPLMPMANARKDKSKSSTIHYRVTTVDARGRLADRSPILFMQWTPELPISVALRRGIAFIREDPNGPDHITRQGHIRLPLSVRRALGLNSGDRILIVADPLQRHISIYTARLIEELLDASDWRQAERTEEQ